MERSVKKNGGSLYVTIGKEFSEINDIEKGDVLVFEVKEVRKCKKKRKK